MKFAESAVANVATVPTVYGIETTEKPSPSSDSCFSLQQYLPFTVLKPSEVSATIQLSHRVATVPTVYGIETQSNC